MLCLTLRNPLELLKAKQKSLLHASNQKGPRWRVQWGILPLSINHIVSYASGSSLGQPSGTSDLSRAKDGLLQIAFSIQIIFYTKKNPLKCGPPNDYSEVANSMTEVFTVSLQLDWRIKMLWLQVKIVQAGIQGKLWHIVHSSEKVLQSNTPKGSWQVFLMLLDGEWLIG